MVPSLRHLALRPSDPRCPVDSKSSVAKLTAPAAIGRGQAVPIGRYWARAAGRRFSRKWTQIYSRESRRGWAHLSAYYRVCAFEVGKVLDPGSLESVYEKALCLELAKCGPQPSVFQPIFVHWRQKRRYRI